MLVLTLVALAFSFYKDPASGQATWQAMLQMNQAVWAVFAACITLKIVLNYKEANKQSLLAKALESPTGAGLGFVGVIMLLCTLLLVFAPRAFSAELPENYLKYKPIIDQEQKRYWPDHPRVALLPAALEQESCPSLKSKSCFSPSAQLKTAREEGAGPGQITRAYRPDGTLRFDALAGLVSTYPNDLKGFNWGNVYSRPDFQFRAFVLMMRDASRQFQGSPDWLQFGDAAYNGGVGGVRKERRACAMTAGCDPSKWFGNVEKVCLKSRVPIYGNRSACDINREHVDYVFNKRVSKYES
jgi:hypothetical protein